MSMRGRAMVYLALFLAAGGTSYAMSLLQVGARERFVQQGPKLVGTGAGPPGNPTAGSQGSSVAISADGKTALVGGDGAAWVFVRSGARWVQQGPKLVGTGDEQAGGVALSADGDVALIGAASARGAGATFVFTRSGSRWSQEAGLVGTGAVQSCTDAGVVQGSSVALSADGNTALVGGPGYNHNRGAAWVFKRSGSRWLQEGPKLVGTGAVDTSGNSCPFAMPTINSEQGFSVALSGDGKTAMIGGPWDNGAADFVGAAWIFHRTNTRWSQQGPKLIGSGISDNGDPTQEGFSVALSANGNTALSGGPYDNCDSNCSGAAWVFTRSGKSWSQHGSKLVGTGAQDSEQGYGVALSADGNTAVIGGWSDGPDLVGASWVFHRAGTRWSQQGSKLVGTGATRQSGQGSSVALSADGSVALIGGPGDTSNQGATWVFIDLPDTKIVQATVEAKRGMARFGFKSIGPVIRFECALVRPRGKHHARRVVHFAKCSSPNLYKQLQPDHYEFLVRAVNSAGNDPTPAIERFTII